MDKGPSQVRDVIAYFLKLIGKNWFKINKSLPRKCVDCRKYADF